MIIILVSFLRKPAKNYMHWLEILSTYLKTSKLRVLIHSFITSQFSHCPLIWMFRCRKIEHKINKIHEMALRFIYPSDLKLTFKELLDKIKTVSIHLKTYKY